MKILYVSCHSVLQVDETKLLKNLGHEVDIVEPSDNSVNSNASLYDVILICHRMNWFQANFTSLDTTKQKVFYRSVGQSTPQLESQLRDFRERDVLKIIRYSPMEINYTNYAGADGLVRFSKDENIYKDWNGSDKKCVMFSNHIWNRTNNCKLLYMEEVTKNLNRTLYGWGNEKIETIPTKELQFDEIPEALRDARVLFYTGTFPASYTLNFIEALMTGIPIVSISKNIFYEGFPYFGDIFEVPHMLEDYPMYPPGFTSNYTEELLELIIGILENDTIARRCSFAGRELALELFSENVVSEQWKECLEDL